MKFEIIHTASGRPSPEFCLKFFLKVYGCFQIVHVVTGMYTCNITSMVVIETQLESSRGKQLLTLALEVWSFEDI